MALASEHTHDLETTFSRDTNRDVYRPLSTQAPKRVLIVDDDYDSIRLLQRTLSEFGCYVQIAMDGFNAVDLLMDHNFDIVFLDWKMPGIEGGETIERAEKNISTGPSADPLWINKRLPVITYSSSDSSDLELPKTRHFAFIDHWMKPMKYDELHFQVREALNYVSNPTH